MAEDRGLQPPPWTRFASLAIVTGLICGLLDAAALQWNLLGSRGWYDFLPGLIWIEAPAVFIAFTLASLAPLLLVPRRYRSASAAVLLTLAGPGLLLLVRVAIPLRLITPRVNYLLWGAGTLLIVIPLAWLASRSAERMVRARWTGPIAVTALSIIAIFAVGGVTRATSPPPVRDAPSTRPNILLVFLDTLRFDASGMGRGQERLAPSLARFASQSVVFENAWAPSPWTLPSHLSVVTGLSEPELGISYDQQTYSASRPTMAQVLRRFDYSTTAILANGFLNPGTGFQRGYHSFQYASREVGACRTSLATVIHAVAPAWARVCRPMGAAVTRRAISAMRRSSRPFFVTLNYMDVHAPYDVPGECRDDSYRPFRPIQQYPVLDHVNRFGDPVPAETQELIRNNYALAMRCLDRALGDLFSAVDALPDGRNTYVIIVGDHGEQFGEHNLVLHSNSVYRQVLHVPLAMRGPRLTPRRISEPVSITSLYGTTLGLAGVPQGALPSLFDTSDVPVTAAYRVPDRVINLPPRMSFDATSLVAGPFHYIRRENGEQELYDIGSDPAEERDLSADPRMIERRRALESELLRIMPPRLRTKAEGWKRFFSLGYIQ